jgi:group I intron endonuclease
MFVYLITNTVNGKRYVGQTIKSLEARWQQHKLLKNCRAFHGAIKKYGEDKFIIESIIEPPTIELMDEFESEYIRRYCTLVPNGYNLTEGGRVPRHNSETKEKMSLSHKGTTHPGYNNKSYWTPEKREERSKKHRGVLSSTNRLSEEQVKEIRRLYATNQYSQIEIGIMFSVNQTTISKIILKKSFKFV